MGVQYEVNLGNVRSVISQQQSLSVQIGMVNVSVLQAQTMLRLTMSAAVRSSIDAKLKKIRQDLEDESQSARQMNRTLQEVVDIYNSTEQQAMDAQKDLSADGNKEPSGWPKRVGDLYHILTNITDQRLTDWLDLIASLVKAEGKLDHSDKTSLIGKLIGIISSAADIASSTAKELFGNVTGYVSDSFSILSKLSEMLEKGAKTVAEKLSLSKFGAVTNVISSVTGLIEDIAGVIEKFSDTTGDAVDRFASCAEQAIQCFGSLAETVVSGKGLQEVLNAIKKGGLKAVGKAKEAAEKAGSWLTLVKTVVSFVGSTTESAIQLGADGRISGQDWGEIFVTGAVNGLDTLISGVTLGIFSCQTIFGRDPDECVDAVKSWISDIVKNGTSYLKRNPQLQQEYNESGPLKQNAMLIYSFFVGNSDENRVVVPGENIEPAEGIWMKILKNVNLVKIGNPIMMPYALPLLNAI